MQCFPLPLSAASTNLPHLPHRKLRLLPFLHVKPSSKKADELPEEDEAAVEEEDEYDVAQDKIFHAVEAAEEAVVHAVEEEVDTLFHELPHHEKEAKEPRHLDPNVEEALHAMEDGDME